MSELKDHSMGHGFAKKVGTEAPCAIYEKRPLIDPTGKEIEGLYTAWITLNNPDQFNSYTTEMVKGVTEGFQNASQDRSVVAVILTGTGDKAFCTGGNTKEYDEYYSRKPNEYGEYMGLFNGMVDSIYACKKPTLCRVNGMRIAGGQEIGGANDITIASDMAMFGQAGPRHGSAPDGGATDFLPHYMSIENAMWSCISCETWSAYKMKLLGHITEVVPVLKYVDNFIRNPMVITDRYIENGQIVYGEYLTGRAREDAKGMIKSATTDLTELDKAVNNKVWHMANLFPGCLQKTIDSIRSQKKAHWDAVKDYNRHWLAANMMGEAHLGFRAFNTRKETGKDVIDFIAYRQAIAAGRPLDQQLFDEILPKPKKTSNGEQKQG